MINTPLGVATRDDGYELRRAAVRHGITYATTLAAAQALIAGMQAARAGEPRRRPLAGAVVLSLSEEQQSKRLLLHANLLGFLLFVAWRIR